MPNEKTVKVFAFWEKLTFVSMSENILEKIPEMSEKLKPDGKLALIVDFGFTLLDNVRDWGSAEDHGLS